MIILAVIAMVSFRGPQNQTARCEEEATEGRQRHTSARHLALSSIASKLLHRLTDVSAALRRSLRHVAAVCIYRYPAVDDNAPRHAIPASASLSVSIALKS